MKYRRQYSSHAQLFSCVGAPPSRLHFVQRLLRHPFISWDARRKVDGCQVRTTFSAPHCRHRHGHLGELRRGDPLSLYFCASRCISIRVKGSFCSCSASIGRIFYWQSVCLPWCCLRRRIRHDGNRKHVWPEWCRSVVEKLAVTAVLQGRTWKEIV